jgi:hypothetical protein
MDANRQNAKKSTGPRTPEGKDASSRNRLVHGLRANKHILLDEEPDEFLDLLRDLYDRFQPLGHGEKSLVMRIAADQWRLDRAFLFEAGIYRELLIQVAANDHTRLQKHAYQTQNYETRPGDAPPPSALPDPADRLARAFQLDCAGAHSLTTLARYEGSLEHSIDRTLRHLKSYQAARLASAPNPSYQPSPPPSEPETDAENAAETPAESVATPSNDLNYHSNPNSDTIAQSSAALYLLLVALIHAVPQLFASLASRLTTTYNARKIRQFHPFMPIANSIRHALPLEIFLQRSLDATTM